MLDVVGFSFLYCVGLPLVLFPAACKSGRKAVVIEACFTVQRYAMMVLCGRGTLFDFGNFDRSCCYCLPQVNFLCSISFWFFLWHLCRWFWSIRIKMILWIALPLTMWDCPWATILVYLLLQEICPVSVDNCFYKYWVVALYVVWWVSKIVLGGSLC